MLPCDLLLITTRISDWCHFSDIHILQGSVATCLKPGGIFKHKFVANFLLSLSVKKFETHTHTHPFNSPLSRTTQVSRYQKGKTNLDFTEARDSEWQWHQLGHMQVCTSLQTDNHASTPPLSFLQAGCPSCHPTNSVKALKAEGEKVWKSINIWWSYAQEFGVLFFWLSVVYV